MRRPCVCIDGNSVSKQAMNVFLADGTMYQVEELLISSHNWHGDIHSIKLSDQVAGVCSLSHVHYVMS